MQTKSQRVLTVTQAALDAVRLWTYEPTLWNGQAVAVVTTIARDIPSAVMPPGYPGGGLLYSGGGPRTGL
jgi:hypothetical protein